MICNPYDERDTVVGVPKTREKKRWCGICSLKGEGGGLVKSPVFPTIKIPLIRNICLMESFYFVVGIKAKGHLHQSNCFTQLVRGLAPMSLTLFSPMDCYFFFTVTLKNTPYSCLPANTMKLSLLLAYPYYWVPSFTCHFWEALISKKLDWTG